MARSPQLFSFTSSAVRVCEAAYAAGVDLNGAHFTVVGESVTAAWLQAIQASGAKAAARYAIIECSSIGHACMAPQAPDDVHLLGDLHALIQPGDGREARLPPNALLLSSLRLTAPFVLLNVSMGDQAAVVTRFCGCPLDRMGWSRHLHSIRSYEKLTAGGMTFLDMDVIRVLEEVLPARSGASSNIRLRRQE